MPQKHHSPTHRHSPAPQHGTDQESHKKNTRHLHYEEHRDETARGSPSTIWYTHATSGQPLELPASTHPRVRAEVHRIRLGYPCLQELGEDLPVIFCDHCEFPTSKPLLHYILDCPNTRHLRKPNMRHPNSEDPHAREAAARIIATTPAKLLAEVVTMAPPPK